MKCERMVILDDITQWNEELRENTVPIYLENSYRLGFKYELVRLEIVKRSKLFYGERKCMN